MKITPLLFAALTLGAAATAAASPELAKAKACTACHAASTKLVGPSFKDIAARYEKDARAADTLASKIKAGSKGTWGPVPMPPNPQLSDADAGALARWILTQR